jgi:hypothetical protein
MSTNSTNYEKSTRHITINEIADCINQVGEQAQANPRLHSKTLKVAELRFRSPTSNNSVPTHTIPIRIGVVGDIVHVLGICM